MVKCRERTTDRLYAAKLLSCEGAGLRGRALTEYHMHHSLTHPQIVRVEDAFIDESHLTLVMEL